MQKDLASARAEWINEAEQDQTERERREESDLLTYRDREGRYADFHATGHTFITNLSRAGVSPKTHPRKKPRNRQNPFLLRRRNG